MIKNTDFKIDLSIIKKTNKLLNRMHKKMPYTDTFQPVFDSSIINVCFYWLEMVKYNDMYILLESIKHKNTPYMVIPPLKINGDFPSEHNIMESMSYLFNKIQHGNYKGTRVRLFSIPTESISTYKLPHVNKNVFGKDLVFDIKEQIELPGSKFRKVRNVINNFKRENNYNIVDMKDINTSKYVDEMIELSSNSIENVHHDYGLREVIIKYNKLRKIVPELDGFIVMNDKDEIIGYDIHHKVKYTPTVLGIIKRSAHEYKGLSHFIEHHTAIRMLEKFPTLKFINNSTNPKGIHGDFKKSMHSIRYEHSSILTLKERTMK